MSPRVWIISDTHFGNYKMSTGGYYNPNSLRPVFNSIKEHDDWIVNMWNDSVRKRDVVYHLGDVADSSSGLQNIKKCSGIKHLILGNHDQFGIEVYREAGFRNRILGSIRYKKEFILTHIPVHSTQIEYGWKYNIHGHIHNSKKYPELDGDIRYINANLCVVGKIITIEELIDGAGTERQ